MHKLTLVVVLLAAFTLSAANFTRNAPSSTNNDDSCDISLLPAATLLLPLFDVSPVSGETTTIFTITNTNALPQATLVTLWTDFGYPVLSFPVYLTGYDTQSINLYDVIFLGRLAPDRGTGLDRSPIGELSATDNPELVETTCQSIPVQIPKLYIERMTEAFLRGRVPTIFNLEGCEEVGGVHANARGYVTVDVTTVCTPSLPADNNYFSAEIAYDNVLMGDYAQVDATNDSAQGGPMVHIRAIPEGGNPTVNRPTNFTRTFYSRLQPAARRTLDKRQPLPATFGARWISGTGSGFETLFKIWREVDTPHDAACDAYIDNGFTPLTEVVRFDEDENPETVFSTPVITPPVTTPALAASELIGPERGDVFPPNSTDAVAGWFYFNFDSGEFANGASQNWVTVSMRSEGRYSIDFDATALGNGCSAPIPISSANVQKARPIGPAPNETP